jgi:hypothetical protein
MGSFRFRRTFRIAPGIRLNFNKRSVGISAGVPGARASINSDGRSTRSVGIPGTGLYYRSQTGPSSKLGPSSGRALRHGVGWLAALLFFVLAFSGEPHAAGIVVVVALVVILILELVP